MTSGVIGSTTGTWRVSRSRPRPVVSPTVAGSCSSVAASPSCLAPKACGYGACCRSWTLARGRIWWTDTPDKTPAAAPGNCSAARISRWANSAVSAPPSIRPRSSWRASLPPGRYNWTASRSMAAPAFPMRKPRRSRSICKLCACPHRTRPCWPMKIRRIRWRRWTRQKSPRWTSPSISYSRGRIWWGAGR
ncbi:hypothetical protein D3C84_781770 [compost metagenome]